MTHKLTEIFHKDFYLPAKKRKHIILMDGTWNDETGENLDGLVTNIVHLQRIFIANDDGQIVRYHRGVGNDDDNGLLGNLWKGATGKGVRKIVDFAYARFVRDWHPGDEIFIFGFSRGAAAARLLASKINREGVPTSITITFEPRENKETKVVEQYISKYQADHSHEKHPVDIDFLGVWDTVSAFGLLNNIRRFFGLERKDLFTDHHISSNIKRAVHLLAIDETRNTFVPSLMNHISGITHEVWFPGVHSDVGGSYSQYEIAKVTLHYMLKMLKQYCEKQGMDQVLIEYKNYVKYTLESSRKAFFHFHGLSLGKSLRQIGVQVDGILDATRKPNIHNLYYELCDSHETYVVVKKRKSKKNVRFQYMPINVKYLKEAFKIVE